MTWGNDGGRHAEILYDLRIAWSGGLWHDPEQLILLVMLRDYLLRSIEINTTEQIDAR